MSERNRALVVYEDVIGPSFPAILPDLVFKKALQYSDKTGLRVVSSEEDRRIAQEMILRALVIGAEGKPLPNAKNKLLQYINKGLEIRENILLYAHQTIKDLSQPSDPEKRGKHSLSGFSVSKGDDLGISREVIAAAREEKRHANRLATIPRLEHIARARHERRDLIANLSWGVAAKSLNIQENDEQIDRLKTLYSATSDQAKLLRGYLITTAMDMFINEDKKKTYNPFFLTYQDMPDVVKVGELLLQDQRKVDQVIDQVLKQLDISEHVLTPTVYDIFTNYLSKICEQASRWSKSSRSHVLSPGNPKYWEQLREFFEGLPIDQMGIGHRYGFSLEGAREAQKEGLPHLWTNAVVLEGGWLIPSAQDLSAAINIMRKVSPLQYVTLFPRLLKANAALIHYYNVKENYPDAIVDLKRKVEEYEALIPEADEIKKRGRAVLYVHANLSALTKERMRYESALERDATIRAITEVNTEVFDHTMAAEYLKLREREASTEMTRLNKDNDSITDRLQNRNWLRFPEFYRAWKAQHKMEFGSPNMESFNLSELFQITSIAVDARGVRNELRKSDDQYLPSVVRGAPREAVIDFLKFWKAGANQFREENNVTAIINILERGFPNPGERQFIKRHVLSNLKITENAALRLADNKQFAETANLAYSLVLQAHDARRTGDFINFQRILKDLKGTDRINFEKEMELMVFPDELKSSVQEMRRDIDAADRLLTAHDRVRGWRGTIRLNSVQTIAKEVENASSRIVAHFENKSPESIQKIKQYLDALKAMQGNRLLPQGEGIWIGSLIHILRHRTRVAEALLNIDKITAEIEDKKAKLSEQKELGKIRQYMARLGVAKKNLDEKEAALATVDETLFQTMQECGFLINQSDLQ